MNTLDNLRFVFVFPVDMSNGKCVPRHSLQFLLLIRSLAHKFYIASFGREFANFLFFFIKSLVCVSSIMSSSDSYGYLKTLYFPTFASVPPSEPLQTPLHFLLRTIWPTFGMCNRLEV